MRSVTAVLVVAPVFAAGCVTTSRDVGSHYWHEQRIMELDSALESGEIDKEQYLQLKLEADEIRGDYLNAYRAYPLYRYPYYYPYYYGFGYYPYYW